MLGKLCMVGVRGRSKARKYDWDATADGLAAIQSSLA